MDLLLTITSTTDQLLRGVNIQNWWFERPWKPKTEGFCGFLAVACTSKSELRPNG